MPLFRNEHSKPSKLKHKFKPRIPNLKSLYNKAFGRQTCVPTPRPASECYQSTARLIASSNPPPPLPSDILYYIFSMMVEKNLKTLNTCILVNKSWCEHALPIFWREPFRGGEPICVSVVDNYIGCLSDEEREVLEECGIRLRTYKGRSSCINYAQYLRYLSMADLYTVVRAWTDRTQIRRSRRHSRNTYSTYTLALNLGQMLCKLFLSDRANILSLSLDWGRGYPSWLYAGGLTPNLTHLRRLSIHHINEWSIFSHLANYAVNIQDLEILDYSLSSPALHSEEVSLAKFIECQNRLTKFKLFGYGTHPTMIPWSLRSQAKTLKSVEIIHINFLSDEKKGPSLEGLVDCVCLEELCIRFCTDAKRDHLLPLHGATFPYLKKLHFVECTTVAWEELMISLIITNASTLEE
ncbi:2853_t:CDS:2, partial [Paraglomus occultum]